MMGQLQERRVKGTRHGWFSRGAVEVERSEYNIFFFTHTEIASNLCVAGILTQLLASDFSEHLLLFSRCFKIC